MAQAQVDSLRKQIIISRDLATENKNIILGLIGNVQTFEANMNSQIRELKSLLAQYQLAFPRSFECACCGFLCFEEAVGAKRMTFKCEDDECQKALCLGCHFSEQGQEFLLNGGCFT